jgi:phosphohistidine phosphatase
VARDTTRRLVLLRHAKSDWPDVPDRDRPLAKRGRRDAPRIGRWLRERGYEPDVVVCSNARRTKQTWELLAPQLGGSPSVRFEPRAYAASAQTLLYLARELPSRYRTALLIAHNPGTADLANSLAEPPAVNGEFSPAGLRFPTAAVAVFDFDGTWPHLSPGQARLVDYIIPADLLDKFSILRFRTPAMAGAFDPQSFATEPPVSGLSAYGGSGVPQAGGRAAGEHPGGAVQGGMTRAPAPVTPAVTVSVRRARCR